MPQVTQQDLCNYCILDDFFKQHRGDMRSLSLLVEYYAKYRGRTKHTEETLAKFAEELRKYVDTMGT